MEFEFERARGTGGGNAVAGRTCPWRRNAERQRKPSRLEARAWPGCDSCKTLIDISAEPDFSVQAGQTHTCHFWSRVRGKAACNTVTNSSNALRVTWPSLAEALGATSDFWLQM